MPRQSTRPWRRYLTPAEARKIDEIEAAYRKYKALQVERASIVNRAFARLRHAEEREQRA